MDYRRLSDIGYALLNYVHWPQTIIKRTKMNLIVICVINLVCLNFNKSKLILVNGEFVFSFSNIKFVNCLQFVNNISFDYLGAKQRVNIQLNILFCGWESNVDRRTFNLNLLFNGAAKRHSNTRTERYPDVNMKLNFWNNPNRLILFLWYFTNYTSFIENIHKIDRTVVPTK